MLSGSIMDRRTPAFEEGDYQVEPICAGDLAVRGVVVSTEKRNSVADAAGLETFSSDRLLLLSVFSTLWAGSAGYRTG